MRKYQCQQHQAWAQVKAEQTIAMEIELVVIWQVYVRLRDSIFLDRKCDLFNRKRWKSNDCTMRNCWNTNSAEATQATMECPNIQLITEWQARNVTVMARNEASVELNLCSLCSKTKSNSDPRHLQCDSVNKSNSMQFRRKMYLSEKHSIVKYLWNSI